MTRLLARTQQNLSIASLEHEHLPAVADLPAFDARRRSDVFSNDEPFVADFIGGVGFDGEAGAGGYGQRDRTVAGSG